jgi:hypothetical protein
MRKTFHLQAVVKKGVISKTAQAEKEMKMKELKPKKNR